MIAKLIYKIESDNHDLRKVFFDDKLFIMKISNIELNEETRLADISLQLFNVSEEENGSEVPGEPNNIETLEFEINSSFCNKVDGKYVMMPPFVSVSKEK